MSYGDVVSEALEALPVNVKRILQAAEDNGWTEYPSTTLVVRLRKAEDVPEVRAKAVALPFYLSWELTGRTKAGKPSWTFRKAYARNGQEMNLEDALLYLEDESVIYPEPPGDNDAA